MKKTTLTKAAAITCMALLTATHAGATEGTTAEGMNSPAATAYYLKGKVLDDTGEPLTGAVVKIKGTATGVLTDLNGDFTIPVAKQGRYTQHHLCGHDRHRDTGHHNKGHRGEDGSRQQGARRGGGIWFPDHLTRTQHGFCRDSKQRETQ